MAEETRILIIDRLRSHLQELQSFSNGLTEEQLKERPATGSWSIHEIAMHLVELQDVYVEQMARMLVEKQPVIIPHVCTHTNGSYLSLCFPEQIRSYMEQRKTLTSLLQSLDDKQWRREGNHPDVKNYTVEKCMESLMRHEEHHLYEMFNVFFGVKG